ncbi:Uncharacterized protein Adt_16824 [Abeliophyllum distichum]|uniref:DUF4283 domain-containing protein n=1 Tax=Abeliophyllum distichum TaxID=126358 RepID=A0ABD1TEU6_9LAMI
MGKKNRGHSFAKIGTLPVPKPVGSHLPVAESSTSLDQSVLKEFWDGLCKESPVPVLNTQEKQLDSSSFPALPSKSASVTESRTLGESDMDSDSSSQKPKTNSWLFGEVNNTKKSGKAPWINLFKDNRAFGEGLKLQTFKIDSEVLTLEESDLDNVELSWGYCLMGYFAGRFPGKTALLKLCDSWNIQYKYYPHESGWLIFKFRNEEDRMSVLNGGPYFVFGRPLMLKIMPHCFGFDDNEISNMPVWITLPGLPLACWNPTALGKIASMVGKPITTDKLTVSKERLSYARVLVEVDASLPLTRRIHLNLPTGLRYQPIFYEHEPKFCNSCKMFGHSTSSCGSKTIGPEESNIEAQTVNELAPVHAKNLDTSIKNVATISDNPGDQRPSSDDNQNQGINGKIVAHNQLEEQSCEPHEEEFTVVSRNKNRSNNSKGKHVSNQILSSSAQSHQGTQGSRTCKQKNTLAEKRPSSSSIDKKKGPTLQISS